MLLISPELFHSKTEQQLQEPGILSIKLTDELLPQPLDGTLQVWEKGTNIWVNLRIEPSALVDLQVDGLKYKSYYKQLKAAAKEKVYKLFLNTTYGLTNQFNGRICIKELGALVTQTV